MLTDLASVDFEEQTTKLFISRLEQLKDEEAKQFKDAFKSDIKLPAVGHRPVLIQSAFQLPKKQQTEIEEAVDKILGKETEFEFKTAPEIVSAVSYTHLDVYKRQKEYLQIWLKINYWQFMVLVLPRIIA